MRYGTMVAALAMLARSMGGAMSDAKEALLRDGSGAEVGKVTLREDGQRIRIRVEVHGLPSGLHGTHLHAAGRCEGPGFQSAGGHFNPSGMRHGHQNPQGPHLGDLGNLKVGHNQKGHLTVKVSGSEARLGLKGFLAASPTGLALVIHTGRDDETTDPSGNSGARIACAVLQ